MGKKSKNKCCDLCVPHCNRNSNCYYDNDYDDYYEDYEDCSWQQYGPGCGCSGPTRVGNCCGSNRGNGCGCGCSNLGCGRGCYQTAGGALGTSCFFTNPILIWLLLLSRPRFWGC